MNPSTFPLVAIDDHRTLVMTNEKLDHIEAKVRKADDLDHVPALAKKVGAALSDWDHAADAFTVSGSVRAVSDFLTEHFEDDTLTKKIVDAYTARNNMRSRFYFVESRRGEVAPMSLLASNDATSWFMTVPLQKVPHPVEVFMHDTDCDEVLFQNERGDKMVGLTGPAVHLAYLADEWFPYEEWSDFILDCLFDGVPTVHSLIDPEFEDNGHVVVTDGETITTQFKSKDDDPTALIQAIQRLSHGIKVSKEDPGYISVSAEKEPAKIAGIVSVALGNMEEFNGVLTVWDER